MTISETTAVVERSEGVPQSKHLLIGSIEAFSGKSATVLGLALQLREKGLDVAYAKPIGTCPSESEDETDDCVDEDVRFISQTLGLKDNRLRPTLFTLDEATIKQQLSAGKQDYLQKVESTLASQDEDILLIEGPGNLEEGSLFGLSLPDMAEASAASVILVARYHSALIVDKLLAASEKLGDRLLGVGYQRCPRRLARGGPKRSARLPRAPQYPRIRHSP